jgi:CheY-like chemotaxis protein
MHTGDHRAIIILVEEEQDQRRVIAGLLDAAGFAVRATETTDEALRLLEATPDAAGLVTDAHVPGGIDGWELAQRARARRPGLAVILMSGHSDPSSGPLPEGAAFVLKPNVPASLSATLREMIGET